MDKKMKFPCGGFFSGDKQIGGGKSCVNPSCPFCEKPWEYLEISHKIIDPGKYEKVIYFLNALVKRKIYSLAVSVENAQYAEEILREIGELK